MNDTTLTAAERIHAFADAVRAQLADLPAEDVDDLVEGLVGDLTDQAADHGGQIELGDPAAYAQELRDAAGLPERGPVTTAKTPWHERLAGSAGRLAGRIRSSAFGGWLLDLLIALRPVWWVLRGLILAALIAIPAGMGPLTAAGYGGLPAQVVLWALVICVVVVSVQWGRDRWLPKGRWRHIRTAASVIALLFLPATASYTLGVMSTPAYRGPVYEQPPAEGLQLDGVQIGNLFVYDKDGNLIEGAQLYTNRGTPVNLFGGNSADLPSGLYQTGADQNGKVVVPFRDAADRPIWNIYPLLIGSVDGNGTEVDASTAQQPQPPFLRAPARLLASPEPTPGSSTPPTPTPSPTPAPTPTSTPAG